MATLLRPQRSRPTATIRLRSEMGWRKEGLFSCPEAASSWAQHSFATPFETSCDWMRNAVTIRLFGCIRDAEAISRIGRIGEGAASPAKVKTGPEKPVLDLGAPGMIDDSGVNFGVNFGNVIAGAWDELRMYCVGFQLATKAKFLAIADVAVRRKQGESFRFPSPDGGSFTRSNAVDPPQGGVDQWSSDMTSYRAQITRPLGAQYLFLDGNDMGSARVGAARWVAA
eukprot:GHVR01168549.1.p1 GENE.GHVR01168549.1~~GHVR01168549.1.p1  ORF type:complete len:226 (-),score=35.11 GHVR01168549.1:336-1013(-)